MIAYNKFLINAKCLGINLIVNDEFERKFLNIEEFFLDSTLFIGKSYRTARAIEYWAFAFGKYLSVRKIENLIKVGHQYDARTLGGLLSLIDDNFELNGPYKNLSKYTKKFYNKKSDHVPIVAGYDGYTKDPRWLKRGVVAPKFIPDELEKAVRNFKWIKKNCPELRYRMEGMSAVVSDMRAYLELSKKVVSIYKIAKDINVSYPCAHQNFKKHIENIFSV